MKIFLVIATDESEEYVQAQIERHFPDHNMRLKRRGSPIWFVAAPYKEFAASIVEKLNFGAVANDNSVTVRGIVMQANSYYGRDDAAIWQQLEVWEKED